MRSLTAQIRQCIVRRNLFSGDSHVLVAVSGGADSICLLHALNELNQSLDLKLTVAHLDHRIRPGSAADAAFVKGVAEGFGLACVVGRADVPTMVRENRVSLEMAAREARYAFFARTSRHRKISVVATAHTANDQAETVLLKLARGAGAGGAAGIRHSATVNGVRVVRPMLDVTRATIEAYLDEKGIEWREDESNACPDFLRNRVRHEVLPVFSGRLNPDIVSALNRYADVMREEDDWLNALSAEIMTTCLDDSGHLSARQLKEVPVAARRRAIRLWLVESGVPTDSIGFDAVVGVSDLLEGRTGRSVTLADGRSVQRSYDRLLVRHEDILRPAPFRTAVTRNGETMLVEQGLRVVTETTCSILRSRPSGVGTLPDSVSLRLAAVGRKRVYVRSWRDGDRMRPLGMRGSRKIQDIFTDGKVPREERGRIPVFECGGEVVWVPGYRIARGWELACDSEPALHICVSRI